MGFSEASRHYVEVRPELSDTCATSQVTYEVMNDFGDGMVLWNCRYRLLYSQNVYLGVGDMNKHSMFVYTRQ